MIVIGEYKRKKKKKKKKGIKCSARYKSEQLTITLTFNPRVALQ